MKRDRLPAVPWILPTGEECEVPDHWPAAGAAFVARKVEALASNPAVWNKTVLILNYDENDGLFDHVVPPTAPPHTPGEYVHGLPMPICAGFRVPCVVVSRWTAGGWVSSERFDHTSVLRLLEKVTGVHEPNISAWRRKTFGDMTSVFHFHHEHGHPPKLPNAHTLLAKARHEFKHLPKRSPHRGVNAGSGKATPLTARNRSHSTEIRIETTNFQGHGSTAGNTRGTLARSASDGSRNPRSALRACVVAGTGAQGVTQTTAHLNHAEIDRQGAETGTRSFCPRPGPGNKRVCPGVRSGKRS